MGDYFQKNMALYALRNGVSLSTHAAANYMRGEKAYNLRRSLSVVDALLAGYDEDVGPSLYFLDYLASCQKLDKAAHGYAGMFVNRRARCARPGAPRPWAQACSFAAVQFAGHTLEARDDRE